MKKKTWSLILCVLFLSAFPDAAAQIKKQDITGRTNPNTLAEAKAALQTLGVIVDPDNRQQVLDSLQSPDSWVRHCVIRYCGYAEIREALPIFKILFTLHPEMQDHQYAFLSERESILDAVVLMKDGSFQQEFRIEIDSLANHPAKFGVLIRFASYLMTMHHDDYGFAAIWPFYNNADNIRMLRPSVDFLANFSDSPRRQDVIDALRLSARIHPTWYERSAALSHLQEIGDPQIEELVYERSKSDANSGVREDARLILQKLNVPLYEHSLVEALQTETTVEGRQSVYSDLAMIGKLWSYKLLVDTYRANQDTANAWFIRSDLQNPYNLGREVSLPLVNALDTLQNWVLEICSFGWLGDRPFADELNAELTSARVHVANGDSLHGAKQIKRFQQKVNVEFQDSLDNDGRFVTIDAWMFLFNKARFLLERLPLVPTSPVAISLSPSSATAGTDNLALSVMGKAFVPASVVLWNGSPRTTSFVADSILQATILASDIASVGTASIAVVNPGNDTSNVLPFTVTQPPSGLSVMLINSVGTNLTGGALQYYDGSWKDAVNNNDGTFRVNTTVATVSLRMTYAYGSQTKSNVTVGPDVVVFQTVNTQVKLQNSQGALIDTGTVQYYFSSWRDLSHTINGVARAELLPANYTFRMTYATATNDKQQNIGSNPTVVFQTVNAAVQLQNSQGALIDTGTVQYYFSSWKALGHTVNGVATAELLPANYTFRMSYAYASKDKQQNIGTNPIVVFNTVNAIVHLKNSQGAFIDEGTVQYYFNSWKMLGHTMNGVAVAELLPASYTFRMAYETVTNDKVQNISTNSTVSFSTVLCTVRVRNSQSQPIDGALISYYFSSWRQIGTTINGEISKELLPANLTFRETIGSATQNKVQNIGTNALVEFSVQ